MIIKKPKPVSYKTVKKRADTWFGRYIRLRDTNVKNGVRVGTCCTCGKNINIYSIQCGHFQLRDRYPVRWDDHNAYGQCESCNGFNAGEQYKMGLHIDDLHGKGTALELEEKGKAAVRLARDFPKFRLQAIADDFKKRCEKIVGERLTEKRWYELLSEWREE